ncbi:MAG: PD40 domain-containing protein [Anaerolineae bacterium]|nr:PD40 domain-containing protein [Anaerolineae bacterium]
MPNDVEYEYHIRVIRDLLLDAFTAEDLRDCFLYTANDNLKPLLHKFGAKDNLAAMVAATITYCEKSKRWAELLKEVEEANPNQWERYKDRVRSPIPSTPPPPPGPPIPAPPTQEGFLPNLTRKQRQFILIGAIVVGIVLLLLLWDSDQMDKVPRLTVESHHSGDLVDLKEQLSGTYAGLESDWHLWSIVHPSSSGYWVQKQFIVAEPDGEWTIEARFGYESSRDIGESFEFLLLAVEEGSDGEKLLQNAQGRPIEKLPTEKVYALETLPGLIRAAPTDCWLADFWANDAWAGEPLTTTREITSTFLFQEWADPPFPGMPETGWTARFVRRIRFPADDAYCFYRVRDNEVELLIDGETLSIPRDAPEWMYAESECVDLEAGFHDIQVDLANTGGRRAVVELWYTGDGIKIPEDGTSGIWQAIFYPTAELGEMPVWRTNFPGPALNYEWSSGDESPVISFGARFTSTLVVTRTARYRFDLELDDGGQFYIDGEMVLDEFHGGPGKYVIERNLEVGSHTLRLDYYEYLDGQYARIRWAIVPEPVHPVQRILFVSNRDRDGDDEIYVMDSNGANPIQLTENAVWDHHPAWSPDGSRIVFASAREEAVRLYVMDADGGNVQPLNVSGYEPRWSPDGSRIAFVSEEDGDPDIYVVDADGIGARNLTNNNDTDYAPDWSPDGSHLVFETDREEGDFEIYVMAADGANPVNLSHHAEGWDGTPTWSPDGQSIAFSSRRNDNVDIYIMDADGENQQRMTTWELEDKFPDWSLDGRCLVFQGTDAKGGGGWGQIYYTVPGQDADRVALTDSYGKHEVPQWSPLSQGFIFESLTNGNDVKQGAMAAAGNYVWTGGSGGVVRWDRDNPDRSRKFLSEDGLAGNDVKAILAESDTTIWFGTGEWFGGSGLSRYTFDEGREIWRTFSASDGLGVDTVLSLYHDSQDRIWAGTAWAGPRTLDGQRWTGFDEASSERVYCIYESANGALWFCFLDKGIARYDPLAPKDTAWQQINLKELLGSDNNDYLYPTDIVQDASGELWITTNAGVVRCNCDGEPDTISAQAAGGELDVWASAARRDKEDVLWFATTEGVVRVNPDGQRRRYTSKDGLTGTIYALALDDEGILWAAGNGLNRYDAENDRWLGYRLTDGLAHNNVSAILQDNAGALWFAQQLNWPGGVTRYTPGSNQTWERFDTDDGLSASNVHVLYQDRDGRIWLGFNQTGGGACRYDPDTETWLCYEQNPYSLVSNNVDSIVQTSDGAMWFGTSGGGLSRFDGEDWEAYTQANSALLSDEVHCLAEDSTGALWITTDQGVNRFLYETGEWRPLTTDTSELINNKVWAVAPDREQGIWLGTKEGLSHYNIETRRWRNYQDGPKVLWSTDGCSQSLLVDRYGTLWMGTDEGLYRQTPDGGWLHLTPLNGLASNHILAIFEDVDGVIWIGTPSGISRLTIKQ